MKFWAIDSPVMRVLGRLGDIIILNMIFAVSYTHLTLPTIA